VFLDCARPILRCALAIAGAAALAACAGTRGGPIPYDRQLAEPDAPTVVPLEAGYKIAPMDKLAIKVFKMEDLSGDYDVDLAGHISLPLIGELDAANLTTAELDDALTRKLGEKYLENPDVSVALKQSVGRMVTLDGAVREPGSYPVMRNLTLIQAVAMAKGVTEDSNPRRVAVFRTINGKRQAAAFDLVDIRRGQATDPAIYPGDIIVVDGSAIKELQKQILQGLPILSIFSPL
jgi:polysaccharide biosynthesis/export protein